MIYVYLRHSFVTAIFNDTFQFEFHVIKRKTFHHKTILYK